MPTTAQVQPSVPLEAPSTEPQTITEADISAVLEECSGDARAAIRALLLGQAVLQEQLEEARREASWGYVRGRPSRMLGGHDKAEG